MPRYQTGDRVKVGEHEGEITGQQGTWVNVKVAGGRILRTKVDLLEPATGKAVKGPPADKAMKAKATK